VWKFEAENIGKVGHAEISMAPLVLLVGRNNTGKSYIATLLWALLHAQTLIWRSDARDRRPEWCKVFAAQIERNEPAKVEVTQELAGELIKHFNCLLGQNGRELLRDVFAYEGFEQTAIHVGADQPFLPFSAEVLPIAESVEPQRSSVLFRIVNPDVLDSTRLRIAPPPPFLLREPGLTDHIVTDSIVTELIYRVLLGPRNRRQTLYTPAARTGLMLSLRVMITQLFASDSPARVILPRPLRDFLQRLTIPPLAPRSRGSKQEDIATWLENEIMHGKIEVSNDPVPSITYEPENTKISLPLHAASSMITELAPFMILMKQGYPIGQIIFEEPEAHLHLSAQRSMARALARLVNAGINVLVTSHSDTFVQQINNLMHLYNHPQKTELMKKLGYDEADLINPEDAKAYEFSETRDKTAVYEVKKEPEGFVVPTLNDTLTRLAKETIALQEGE